MNKNDQERSPSESVLAKALTKFGEIQVAQTASQVAQTAAQTTQANETNKKIEKLSDKMGELAEVMIRAQEIQNAQVEKNERLEKNQIALGKEFKEYRGNNDSRVNDIEKQVLLLDDTDATNKEKVKDKAKDKADIRNKVYSGVITVIAVAVLGLVWRALTQ